MGRKKQVHRGGDRRGPDVVKPEQRDRQIARAIRQEIHKHGKRHDDVVARWRHERPETWIRDVITYRTFASEGL